MSWDLTALPSLVPLLEPILGDHASNHSARQLHALHLVSGSFCSGADGSRVFQFPVSTRLDAELLKVLLIGPSAAHWHQAETILVRAFAASDHMHAAIAESQILEQLLVVVTTAVSRAHPRRARVVHQGFHCPCSLLGQDYHALEHVDDRWSRRGRASNAPCAERVPRVCLPARTSGGGLRPTIRDVLRSIVNAPAMTVLLGQVHAHARSCVFSSPGYAGRGVTQQPESVCQQQSARRLLVQQSASSPGM